MKNIFLVLTLILTLVSCATVGKVSQRQENGKFHSTKKAKIVKSIPFDLDSHKSLLVVGNDNFLTGMSENLNYFDKVIKIKDLENEIIKAGKQEEVGPLSGKIGLNNAYNKYKPFLYIDFERNDKNSKYLQLKLINPSNTEELFVNEIVLDYFWAGIKDSNVFNPLFNGLIDYIKENSKTYKNNSFIK